MADIEEKIQDRITRRNKLAVFIKALAGRDGLITKFDEPLWNATVESVTVSEKGVMVFAFRCDVV